MSPEPTAAEVEVDTATAAKDGFVFMSHPASEGVSRTTVEAYDTVWKDKGWTLVNDVAEVVKHEAMLKQHTVADDGESADAATGPDAGATTAGASGVSDPAPATESTTRTQAGGARAPRTGSAD